MTTSNSTTGVKQVPIMDVELPVIQSVALLLLREATTKVQANEGLGVPEVFSLMGIAAYLYEMLGEPVLIKMLRLVTSNKLEEALDVLIKAADKSQEEHGRTQ